MFRRPVYWVRGPRIWAWILDILIPEGSMNMSVLVSVESDDGCDFTDELQS